PSMLAFDAPTREECAADRAQSNIPQQALVLLNDPTYLEAARALADNQLVQGEGDQATRIRRAFRSATARDPSARELELLVKLHDQSLASYTADSAAAEALLKGIPNAQADQPAAGKAVSSAERAACVQVGRAILNLHEVITRG
ncbi:MAG: DUF1553 domain-containing protein, partial [Aureliella sp.]